MMGAPEPEERDVAEARIAHLFRSGRKSLLILATESSALVVCEKLRLAVIRGWR
jgi:hypothetical protein